MFDESPQTICRNTRAAQNVQGAIILQVVVFLVSARWHEKTNGLPVATIIRKNLLKVSRGRWYYATSTGRHRALRVDNRSRFNQNEISRIILYSVSAGIGSWQTFPEQHAGHKIIYSAGPVPAWPKHEPWSLK